MSRDKQPEALVHLPASTASESAAHRLVRAAHLDEVFRTRESLRLKYTPGMVWVAKRETLEIRGFYDAMILGSGDKLIFSSACGRYQDAAHAYRMNPRQREHYESWARPFHETVQGRVGYLEGDALHLWHGDLAYRFYSDRYDGFEKFLFDPYTDIARNGDGVWCWNSDKPELHTFARRFFERRWGKV